MATVEISWDGNEGFDIHVLQGEKSPSLLGLLTIVEDDDAVHSGDDPPDDVDQITFQPNFLTVTTPPSNGGVTVDTKTGQVTVVANLPALRLRSFVIEATVRTKPPSPKTFGPIPIRVCVHKTIEDLWLTPTPLTIRRDVLNLKFSVLAEFDDGTVGDVTSRPGITWASSNSATVSVNPTTGALRAHANVGLPGVRVRATHAGKTAAGDVLAVDPWPTPVRAELVARSAGLAKMAQVPNILFLPDGFTAQEKPQFDALVRELVANLHTDAALRPFDLLSGIVNYWAAFVPSRQRGTSSLNDLDLFERRTGLRGAEIPDPVKPTPGTPFTLANLIWEVGLPTPDDRNATAGDKRSDWLFQYGVGVSLGFSDAVFAQWQALHDHRLANERDSAFGLSQGQRPTMHEAAVARSIGFHPLRTRSFHVDDFVRGIACKTRTGEPTIGAIWGDPVVGGNAPSHPDLPSGLRVGQDQGLVYFLLGGARRGGTRFDAIASSLHSEREVRLARISGTKQVNLDPRPLPTSVTAEVTARAAHELAHAFDLDDEYADRATPLSIPDVQAQGLKSTGNVQPSSELAKSATDPTIDPLKVGMVKWRWPRIEAAGVLTQEPQPIAGQARQFRIHLKAGQARAFARDNVVRFRKRPLLANPEASFRLLVVGDPDVGADTVTVTPLLPGVNLTPGDFPAGSVLLRPVRNPSLIPDVLGFDLGLVAPIILGHLGTSGISLNRKPTSTTPRPVCARDRRVPQVPQNLPTGLPPGQPRLKELIVGLYDGGARHDCGVYHPSGACIMRRLQSSAADPKTYQFCPVCRYVIVDRFDPAKHASIDADYGKLYPEPKP